MQIKTDKIDSANVNAKAKIPKAFLDEKQKKMVNEIAKTMKVDGFRKGKVPPHVVMARHGKKIEQDAEQEALMDFLNATLKELGVENTAVVGEPSITKMERTDNGLDVEIKISFQPKVDLGNYKLLIPKYKMPRILKKDINERVEKMIKMSAPLKQLARKRAVKSGDFVSIDFEGFVKDIAFDGGKAENYSLEIGSNSFIPGFEDAIIGMKIEENKDIKVTFPKEYNSKELAGKDAIFKVKLHSIEVKDIPKTPSEETLKQLIPGEEKPTLEMLEEQIKEQLKNEKLSTIFSKEVKPAFIEAIVKKVDFALPSNIVEQEIDIRLRGEFQGLSEKEIQEYSKKPEKITKKKRRA